MPTVSVNGVGDIDLPEDLSQDEMTKAILSHPDVMNYMKSNGQYPSYENQFPDNPNDNILKRTNDYIMRNNPGGLRTAGNMLDEGYKGIPVLGNYVGGLQNQDQFEDQHPVATGASRFTGGVAAMAPLTAAAAPAAGAGIGLQMLRQALLGGATNTADYVANQGKNSTLGGAAGAAGIGASAYGLGPAVGKLITPFAQTIQKPVTDYVKGLIPNLDDDVVASIAQKLKDVRGEKGRFISNAQKEPFRAGFENEEQSKLQTAAQTTGDFFNQARPEQVLKDKLANLRAGNFTDSQKSTTNAILTALSLGTGGIEQAVLAHLATPDVMNLMKKPIGKYFANQIMADPSNLAKLNSIVGQGGTGVGNTLQRGNGQ